MTAARIVAGLDPATSPPNEELHGTAGDLLRQAAALPSDSAAASDLPDLFLLAGAAGPAAIVPGAGRVRAVDPIRLVRELSRSAANPRILPGDRRHPDLFGAGGGVLA